jgi:signal transduction histidine kinase
MGNHRVASTGPRTGNASQSATEATASRFTSPRGLNLKNWPVSTRLIAVIILALLMGLVFGGLQVASTLSNAQVDGRVSQLASLGRQVADLVQALQVERDQTAGDIPKNAGNVSPANVIAAPFGMTKSLDSAYSTTDAAAARVRSLAAGIGSSFPANIRARVATVVSDINDIGNVVITKKGVTVTGLREEAEASQSALSVINAYSTPIADMIALEDQVGQGTSDSTLVSDVQTLNSLALAKDQAAQQRALLFNAFVVGQLPNDELQALVSAQDGQVIDLTAFGTTATPAQQSEFDTDVAGAPKSQLAAEIEIGVQGSGSLESGLSLAGLSTLKPAQVPTTWYKDQSVTVDGMQQVELDVATNIVARAQSLQHSAQNFVLFTIILVAVILLLILLATVVVARSLVGPLRKLREGALTIASVELPERVRLLSEAQDPSTSIEVKPIDVLSTDEIGQVARAFDQVHSEAVRLASNEAILRNSFNAMFVNLSRRSQSLIERLARMIDSLEQNEGDPEQLSNLFSMDHLVTRMRRNSENLLVLAGHEGARKWSEPVSLADVARAAVSEIEQYSRVTLKIQPGIAVTGAAVSDVVHLLAEVIENATIFSARDTPVHVSGQELPTGGVLIEVADSGVGISESRLAEMNWRLDNPPVMDVSVSRHMGLFAVARLAERHGVRIRLRPRSPQGLTALIWLPEGVTERSLRLQSSRSRLVTARGGSATGGTQGGNGGGSMPMHVVPDVDVPSDRIDSTMPIPIQADPSTRTTAPASAAAAPTVGAATAPIVGAATAVGAVTSDWFRARRPSTGTPATSAPAGTPAAAGTAGTARTAGNFGNGESPAFPMRAAGAGRFETDGWAMGKHAAQIIAQPVRGESTAAGLPVRVPQANLIAGSLGGGRRGGSGGAGLPADHDTPASTAPPSRSPDLARNRLSGFQRGASRAKGAKPRADQGADS